MAPALVVAVAICVLVLMSVQANRRFKAQDRLPMQWSLDGSVNWTAPRRIALAFTPVLAGVVLSAAVALTTIKGTRPGQEGLVIPSLVFGALTFVAAHGFHLWLIGKSLRRRD